MSAREDVSFLVGSETRVAILRAIVAAPRRPTELANECSCARETAQRTLSGFLDRGWAEKADGRYRSTPAGDIVLDEYDNLETAVMHAARFGEFFTHVDDDAAPPSSVLDDLTVTESTAENPHAPIDRYLTVLETDPVDQFWGITPIASRVFNEAAEEAIGPDTAVELILDRTVLRTSRAEFRDATRTAAELDEFSLYVAPEPVDFGLAVLDDRASVGAYDVHGNLVATVDGTTGAFVEWAGDLFRTYRERADMLDASEYL